MTAGRVTLDGHDVLAMDPYERAVAGLYLALQYPIEVPGVRLEAMLAEALIARGRSTDGLLARLREEAGRIGFDERFLDRPLNVDLSGGEKKRNETLQLAVLQPRIASWTSWTRASTSTRCGPAHDEEAATHEDGLGVLAITHYNRLLHELKPDRIHVLIRGRVVASRSRAGRCPRARRVCRLARSRSRCCRTGHPTDSLTRSPDRSGVVTAGGRDRPAERRATVRADRCATILAVSSSRRARPPDRPRWRARPGPAGGRHRRAGGVGTPVGDAPSVAGTRRRPSPSRPVAGRRRRRSP